MDKGQHLRLFILEGSGQNQTNKVIAMSTDLSLHGSAQTENSTTKDTTDATGAVWDEFEVTGRTYEINFAALIAAGTDDAAKTFADMLSNVNDTVIDWVIAVTSGEKNRTKGTVICAGQAKLTNIQATGQVNQQATYSGTLNGFGPLVPTVIFNQ